MNLIKTAKVAVMTALTMSMTVGASFAGNSHVPPRSLNGQPFVQAAECSTNNDVTAMFVNNVSGMPLQINEAPDGYGGAVVYGLQANSNVTDPSTLPTIPSVGGSYSNTITFNTNNPVAEYIPALLYKWTGSGGNTRFGVLLLNPSGTITFLRAKGNGLYLASFSTDIQAYYDAGLITSNPIDIVPGKGATNFQLLGIASALTGPSGEVCYESAFTLNGAPLTKNTLTTLNCQDFLSTGLTFNVNAIKGGK